jgi:hypothetical protein
MESFPPEVILAFLLLLDLDLGEQEYPLFSIIYGNLTCWLSTCPKMEKVNSSDG